MSTISVTAETYCESYVRPLAALLDLDAETQLPTPPSPYHVFKAAVVFAAGSADALLSIELPDLPGGGDSPAPPVPAPGLAPIDPVKVLKALAEAVRDAERILNEENLALGSASAEVNVVVDVGGLAGGAATLKLNLGPTPRG